MKLKSSITFMIVGLGFLLEKEKKQSFSQRKVYSTIRSILKFLHHNIYDK